MLPGLYLHGLSNKDFELALRGLLGEEAPLSASSIQRLKVRRKLNATELLSLVASGMTFRDGIRMKSGHEKTDMNHQLQRPAA